MKGHCQKLLILSASNHCYSIFNLSTMVMEKHEIPFPVLSPYNRAWPSLSYSPCDGWLLLNNGSMNNGTKRFFFNPSTKETREFPYIVHGFESQYGFRHCWVYYDSYLDDYKLVGVIKTQSNGLLVVFSLKRNCCTKTIHFPHAEEIEFLNLSVLNGKP
ncbi:hypothetical protein Tsubulata_009831, partial [Turnera subulata]